MKKLTNLTILLFIGMSVYAQSHQDSIQEAYTRINNLENRLSLQDSRIAQLLQQVDEVTRQNLALKKNLNLSPTIASAKAGEIMEYRIIEVTGDTATNTVHMTMIADNISGVQKRIGYFDYQVIDDQGHGYDNSLLNKKIILSIEGDSEQLLRSNTIHQPNAPHTVDINLKGVNPDIQYIKHFSLDVTNDVKHYPVVFQNLPIKWNN